MRLATTPISTTTCFSILATWLTAVVLLTLQSCHAQSDDSSCNTNTDQASCFASVDSVTGEQCQWCIAGAIPSECMSQEQSSILPSGVFDCITPTNNNQRVFQFNDDDDEADVSSLSRRIKTKSYHIKTNQKEVSDLCDATSNSISGYMDIKGSDYDKTDENKHLFFWMFEKRGGSNDTTPVRCKKERTVSVAYYLMYCCL
jgi:hypothetical protein